MLLSTQDRTCLLPSHYLSCLPLHISPFQLLTLVILATYLYSLHLPYIYIETLELHSKSSCSFNLPTLHCYSYEPGSHSRIALPANQSIGSHYLLHYLLSNQSATSFKKSLLLPPLQCFELLPGTTLILVITSSIPNDLLQPRYTTIRQNRPTPPQRNDLIWHPSESPASAIT